MASLTPAERARAETIPVWIVWWELPDKSWEAVCLSEEEAEGELRRRQEDHLIKSWGNAGKSPQQSLLQWLESNTRAGRSVDTGTYTDAAREVLQRIEAGVPGPIIVRT